MEKGHLRCDANISIEVDGKEGVPIEIKNMNSFRMVERALTFEEKRQKEELQKGNKIIKETRGWIDTRGITVSQRGKEYAQDYRYFPEPDLPPFKPSKLMDIEKLKKELPELPARKRLRFTESMKLPIQDAAMLAIDQEMAKYFERIAEVVTPKLAANWVINELKSEGILVIRPEDLADLLVRLEKGEISGKISKEILNLMRDTGKKPGEIIEEKGFKQIGGEEELASVITEVIKENHQTVSDYRDGKKEALGFLVGQVMRKTGGQANPQIVNKILQTKLKE